MKPIHPSLSTELKQKMQAEGLVPFVAKPLQDFYNPHTFTHKCFSAGVFFTALLGRVTARRVGAPTFFWTTALLAVPFFHLMTVIKLDSPDDYLGHRRTLDERLELNPITRRAWQKALEINGKYQEELKAEIASLEKKLEIRSAK